MGNVSSTEQMEATEALTGSMLHASETAAIIGVGTQERSATVKLRQTEHALGE